MTEIVDRLVAARDEYEDPASEHYDEVLNEVADRAASVGSLGKVEIGALVVWKRLRANTPWVMSLMGKPDAEVREITAAARTAALDPSLSVVEAAGQARNALKSLPGWRKRLASAILTALAPDRMAVYDRRAYSALSLLFDGDVPRSYSYADYMKTVDDLRQQVGRGWRNRDVDLALFTLGERSNTT